MTRIASVLSVVALIAATLAYSITHWAFPPVGFEGALLFGGVLLWLGAVAAVVAAMIGLALFFYGGRRRLPWPLVCAVLAGLVLFVTVRSP